jgi:hypothetical protein
MPMTERRRAAREIARKKCLEMQCPKCGAPSGESCFNLNIGSSEQRNIVPHRMRVGQFVHEHCGGWEALEAAP